MPMTEHGYSLAIDTSSREGSVTLGRQGAIVASLELSQPRRHNVELASAIDHLFQEQGAAPNQLQEVFVSIGPGSFTGLRVAVATLKMLCYALGARAVAVPTVDVIVENAPPSRGPLAVCLDMKRSQMYCCVYQRDRNGWHRRIDPALMTPEELCSKFPQDLAVLGRELPERWPHRVERLDPKLAVPRSETVWRLGYQLARENRYADALTLVPTYARRPEAEELWEKRSKSK